MPYYSADWDIQAEPGWTVILLSPDGRSKLDLLPDKPFESRALDEMIAGARRGDTEILCEEQWELAGGVPAVRMQIKDELGKAAVLYIVIDGRSLALFGFFDTASFDAIARSLCPVP